MSEERLLPCPFCGGNPKPDHCDGEDYVWCNACDFYTEHHIWNRRSLPAQHVAVPVEKLVLVLGPERIVASAELIAAIDDAEKRQELIEACVLETDIYGQDAFDLMLAAAKDQP